MTTFVIESLFNGEWSDDPSLVGDVDNTFPSEQAAIAAVDALVAVGFDRDQLRVKPAAEL